MELPIVTKQDLEMAKSEIIDQVRLSLQEVFLESRRDEYLTSEEVCKVLDICPRQFQKYRDERQIAFTQYGRKIFVRRSDLDVFMEKHRIKRRD